MSPSTDQRAAKDFVKKQGIKNVNFLQAVVISRADQMVADDLLKEKEHREKFGKALAGSKRLLRVNIEEYEIPPMKKKKKEKSGHSSSWDEEEAAKRLDYLIVEDEQREKEHRAKFGEALSGKQRLICVNIENWNSD